MDIQPKKSLWLSEAWNDVLRSVLIRYEKSLNWKFRFEVMKSCIKVQYKEIKMTGLKHLIKML